MNVCNEKVRTIEKPISSEVWEYLEEQVEHLVNSKVRTLKTLIIPNEKDPEGSISKNGAPNGLLIDPIILQLKNAVSTVECEYCLYNLSKIAA